MQQRRLFRDGQLGNYLGQRRKAAQDAIQGWDPDSLLNTPTADVVAELIDRFGVEPLRLHIDQMEQLPTKDDQVDVSQDFLRNIPDRTRPYFIPGASVSMAVPFDGDPKLFTLRASSFTFNPPTGQVRNGELIVTFTGVNPSAEQVKAFFDHELGQIRQHVEFVNNDVNRFASPFLHELHDAVEARKAKLLADRGLEGALGIPVRRRPDASTRPVPVTRTRLGVQRSRRPAGAAQPYRDEPTLDQAHYEEILDIIQAMGRGFERSPTTFAKLDEEELRDHILLQLNGTFEGQAGGELFNGEGKTDILVRVEDRTVFIGECKFWTGTKAFTDAIDQLRRYVIWRDTKAALVLFIRQADATAIIDKADAAIRAHTTFKRPGPATGDPEVRRNYVLHQTGDTNREIHLALLPVVIRQPSTDDKPA
jgi:hypothetical protein